MILSTQHVPWTFPNGEPLTQLPAADLTDVKCNRLSRWQSYQQQLQQFWKRWLSDYLKSLQQRHRWLKASPNLQPRALVLSKEDNTTPFHWPTAVVTNIHPGQDGIVRVVTIHTPEGVFNVPPQKFAPYIVQVKIYSVSVFWGRSMYTQVEILCECERTILYFIFMLC